MIIILTLVNISLLLFGAHFKNNYQRPEDIGMIIGKYLGFPLKTLSSKALFSNHCENVSVKYHIIFGDRLE